MTDLIRRQQTLDRALAEFERAHARRRLLRRVGGAAAACALIASASLAAWVATRHDRAPDIIPAELHRYPSYVQVIGSDLELADELDAADACQGVGRDGDRVFIVECSATTELPQLTMPPAQ